MMIAPPMPTTGRENFTGSELNVIVLLTPSYFSDGKINGNIGQLTQDWFVFDKPYKITPWNEHFGSF